MQETEPVSQTMHDYVRLCSHIVLFVYHHYIPRPYMPVCTSLIMTRGVHVNSITQKVRELHNGFDLDYVIYMYIFVHFFFQWLLLRRTYPHTTTHQASSTT